MKPIKSTIILLLVLTSCSFSNNDNFKRKDVLGHWELMDKGMIEASEQKPKAEIITHFKLNKDSTATIYYANTVEKNKKCIWKWQAQKRLGNDNFGISLKSDVFIFVNGLPKLGLVIEETLGKTQLTAGDLIFERKTNALK